MGEPPRAEPGVAAPGEDAPGPDDVAQPAAPPRAHGLRSAYRRILVAAAVGLLGWQLLPHVPRDQTVIFSLGSGSSRVTQLEVLWEAEGQDHEGRLVLNFPAPPPERLVRQFRLADGEYEFRVAVRLGTDKRERTEATRRVTLEGNTVTLHFEELTQ